MVQAKNGSIIATIIVCAVLIAGFVYLTMPETPVVNVPVVSVPTAAEIAALVKIPEIPAATTEAESIDTAKLDRLCELTNGCEVYEIHGGSAISARDEVTNEIPDSRDFERAFSNLVEIDRDYLIFNDTLELRDYQVTATTQDDKDNDNYLVELFYKVKFKDSDNDDWETAYVLVSATLDEGDYDGLSIEEVSRNFEFD